MSKVCAVLVTYQPTYDVGLLLAELRTQVDHVYIINNGSLNLQALVNDRVSVTVNASNVGLAAAQNQGIRTALDNGFDWVLLIDDDSMPEPQMVAQMLATQRGNDIGILAPRIVEQNVDAPARYPVPFGTIFIRRVPVKPGEDLLGAMSVIASGSLIHKSVFENIGLMNEAFFIDYIDHEFCLRARAAGIGIKVVGDAALYHRQGHKSRHAALGLPVITANYSPARRFTIFRNRMFVLRRYGKKFPFLWAYEITASLWDLARIICFEEKPLSKFRSAMRGLWAGISQPLP